MKRIATLLGTVALLLTVLTGCRSTKQYDSTYATVPFDSHLMAHNNDGTLLIRAYGSGANFASAMEDAVSRAVSDVIFKGVGSVQPLVYEVNARERYTDYFDPFFSRGGAHTLYGKPDESSKKGREESKIDGRRTVRTYVIVDRPALRQRLVNDGILKQ